LTTSESKVRQTARRLFRVLLLPGFALSLLAAMWIALILQMSSERAVAHHDAVVHSQSLARVLSEHVTHILRQSDHATQLFKLKYEENGGKLTLSEFARRNGLLDSVLPARLDLPMAVIDRHGKRTDSANAFIADDVAGEPYFQTLAGASGDAALFSTPLVDPRTKKWQIQVARRLNDSAGRFDGVIVLMIDPLYFIDDYDRLNVGDDDAMFLLSRATGLSIGRVGERLVISDRIDFVARGAFAAAAGEVLPKTQFDTGDRIYGYSDMPRYTLAAVVGVTRQTAMAKFERHRQRYTWIALAVTFMILAVVTVLMKQSARLRASIRAAHDAQATLRAAADGSLDGVLFLTACQVGGQVEDFLIADINDKGAAMLGRPRAALLGQRAFTLLPRYSRTGFFQRYRDVFTSGVPLEEEVEIKLDEGSRWIHHQIVPIPGGVAVTSRDITARKRTEIEIIGHRGFLQSLIDHLPLLIYVKSVRPVSFGTMVVWNKAAEAVTGYSAADVIGKTDCDAFPPGFGLCQRDEDDAMMRDPRVMDLQDKPLQRPDGALRFLHALQVPLFDEGGRAEYILCIAEDITVRREQEQSLRTSEAQLAAVTNASPLGLIRADTNGSATYINRMFETITGLTREQALGNGWIAALHPDDRDSVEGVFKHQKTHLEPYKRIVRCLHADGKVVWASMKVAAVRIGERIEGFVGSIDDITSLREAEMALRESEARLRTIADTLPAMVAYIDAGQVYRFHNLAYDREFRRDGRDILGHSIVDTLGEARYQRLLPYILRALSGERLVFEEHDESSGIDRTLEVSYIPQLGDDGETVVGYHVMRQDITSQKREKRRLLKLAQVDALTGLANRAGFLQKLDTAMQQSADEGQLMAVMYMDIDHFKPVNDTYGHNVGDALLKAFSARLTQTMRASDTVARLGGDEFTIIMERIARPEDASAIAAKIVTAMQMPFELDGVRVSVSASIGLAYFRDGAVDPDALLKEADMLLYQAKQAGRNTYRAAA